jgi:hypothetical protein
MADNSYLGTDETPVIPPTSDEKTLALLAHVLTFVLPILAPLVIYLVKKMSHHSLLIMQKNH